jgi:hypothetical protein
MFRSNTAKESMGYIQGEISMLNEVLEISNRVFGVLDSQDKKEVRL